jgi:hypothetical protein
MSWERAEVDADGAGRRDAVAMERYNVVAWINNQDMLDSTLPDVNQLQDSGTMTKEKPMTGTCERLMMLDKKSMPSWTRSTPEGFTTFFASHSSDAPDTRKESQCCEEGIKRWRKGRGKEVGIGLPDGRFRWSLGVRGTENAPEEQGKRRGTASRSLASLCLGARSEQYN